MLKCNDSRLTKKVRYMAMTNLIQTCTTILAIYILSFRPGNDIDQSWSFGRAVKALCLGRSSKERGFKSHRLHFIFLNYAKDDFGCFFCIFEA